MSPAPVASDPLVAEAQRRALDEVEARRQRRDDSDARAARERSRFAHAGLGRREAWALGRAYFPGFLGQANGAPARLPNGWRIAEPINESVARIHNAEGKPAGVAVSTGPLAVEVNGQLDVVDLSLESTAAGFRSRRAAAEVSYPALASGAVALPETGVSFQLGGAQAVTSVPESHELFYPDAIPGDVDLALVPQAEGVEVLWQLRTAASPEQLQLSFQLPASATLEPEPPAQFGARPTGAMRVRDATGRQLLRVSAPAAFDADGTEVPVTVSASAGELQFEVDHQGKDLAYPILVDPVVQEYWNRPTPGNAGGFRDCGTPWGGGSNSGGGAWTPGTAYPNNIVFTCDMTAWGWGSGLYTILKEMWHPDWTWGQWVWGAPADSYISSIYWDNTRHGPGNNVPGNTVAFAGLWTGSGWGNYYEWGNAAHWSFTQGGSPATNVAVFGLRTVGAGQRGQGWELPVGHSGLEGATVTLNDAHDPTVGLLYHSHMVSGASTTSWIDPAQGGTWPQFRLRIADRGLGIWQYGVQRTDTGQWMAGLKQLHCVGGVGAFSCVNSYDTPTVNYWDSAMTEGVIPLRGFAWDINERVGGTAPFYLRIDRTPPGLHLSGSLVNAQQTPIRGASGTLQITATDGATSSAGTQRSGVKRIDVWVDGILVDSSPTQSCPAGSCPLNHSFTLHRASHGWPSGATEVRVVAIDQLDHSSEATIYPRFERQRGGGASVDHVEDLELDLGSGAAEPCASPCTSHADVNPGVQDALNAAPLVDADEDINGEPIASTARINPEGFGISDETPDDVVDAYHRSGDGSGGAAGHIYRFRKIISFDVALDYATYTGAIPTDIRNRIGCSGHQTDIQVMDEWYNKLTALGDPSVSMMVSFERNSCLTRDQSYRVSEEHYRDAMLAFFGRYSKVKLFTAWNEPNHDEQGWRYFKWPDSKNHNGAWRAGRRFAILQGLCNSRADGKCRVVAGDFADWQWGREWVRQWLSEYKYGAELYGSGKKHMWAIHPYSTLLRRRPQRLREFVDLLAPGSTVWFTEIGSFLHWYVDPALPPRVAPRESWADQYEDLMWLLNNLAARKFGRTRSPVTHLYYYQWTDDRPDGTQDLFATGLARKREELEMFYFRPYCIWYHRNVSPTAKRAACG